MSAPISIFFAANPGYYQHLCVAITSILENNKDSQFVFYVLTNKIDQTEIDKVCEQKKRYDNFDIQFRVLDDALFQDLVLISKYISLQTYYRYMIPTLYPELDQALYLDCDLVVLGDLKELWKTSIADAYAAGVCDHYINATQHKSAIGLSHEAVYVNAGVLLLNLKKMREDRITETLMENTKKYAGVIKFQDQDVINITMQGKIKLIDQKFNFLSCRSRKALPDPMILERCVIVHYVGERKPWGIVEGCNLFLKEKYYKYLMMTPYKDFLWKYRRYRWFYAIKNSIYWVRGNKKETRIYLFGIRVYKKTIQQ